MQNCMQDFSADTCWQEPQSQIHRFQPRTKRSAPCKTRKSNLVFQLRFPAAPPLLEDFDQLIEAGVMKVKDFILALSAGYHQLPARTGVVTEKGQGELSVHQKQRNSIVARRDLQLT